eukprot:2261967-Amphidinium_carterae.1
MWLFRQQGEEAGDGDSQVSATSEHADDVRHSQDVEYLRSKALEYQAKLEALRAAEYREQLRASCEAHQQLVARYSEPEDETTLQEEAEPKDGYDLSSPVGLKAQHFQFEDTPGDDCLQDDEKLEDMYDFSRFATLPPLPSEGAEQPQPDER